MHVHANQLDPNLQLGAQYAAERAAATKEAAGVRKKLFRLASTVADGGDAAEGDVTAAGERQQPRGQGRQQRHSQGARGAGEHQEGEAAQQTAETASNDRFSTWA